MLRQFKAQLLGPKHALSARVTVDGPAVQLELSEIDENLIRAEFSPIQRADCHARREEILKALGYVAEHGGDRRSSGQADHLESYADSTATKLGVSARSVRRDLHRAKSIGSEIRGVLDKATDSLTGAQLDRIAKASPEQQRHAAEEAKRAGGSKQDRQAAIMKSIQEAEKRSATPHVIMSDSIQPAANLDDINREWDKLNMTGRNKFLSEKLRTHGHPDYSDQEIIDVTT